MIKKVFLVSAAAVTLLLSACLSEVPLNHESYTEGLTVEQVRQAVLDGAKVRGWKTEQVKPGFIVATYTKDKKTASVDILYDANGFRITMNDKTNMVEKNGKVDGKYNQWVNNLNSDISNAAVKIGLPK